MIMKALLFPGCKVPYYAPYYEVSSRLTLKEFNVEIEEMEFTCCGYPIRFLDFKSYIFSSARNIALAAKKRIPLICLCKCCYGTLRYADCLLKENDELRKEINGKLKAEGLQYRNGVEIRHYLNVLFDGIGPDMMQKKITRPLQSFKVAAHYGCHIQRPHDVVEFDDPVKPTKFEKLIAVTGATPVDWPLRLQCCGEPLWDKNQELSVRLTNKKMSDAKQAGADYLCVGCTHCQIQFERARKELTVRELVGETLPSILYPQLLGLSMGLEASVLGIDENFPGLMDILKTVSV
jgi:heterodisulfide reductase subunit B2